MANTDNPNGFRAYGTIFSVGEYTTAAAISRGDAVYLDSDGKIELGLLDSLELCGVAMSSADSGDEVLVYDSPMQQFTGQCSGTYAVNLNRTLVDMEGATGIMEINENLSTYGPMQILHIRKGEEVGANAVVVFSIAKHQLKGISEVGLLDEANTWAETQTFVDDIIGGAGTDIAINTNKFTVAAATGNTVIAGTCGIGGAATVGGTLGVTGATTFTADVAGQTTALAYASQVMTDPVTKAEGELLQTAVYELLTILGAGEQHILTATLT